MSQRSKSKYGFILLALSLFALSGGASAGRDSQTPESVGAIPLLAVESFSPTNRPAAVAVAAELRRTGEEPSEFFASVTDNREFLVFHLWHESAFASDNANVVGNPGGKCRDAYYQKASGTVSKTLFWQ